MVVVSVVGGERWVRRGGNQLIRERFFECFLEGILCACLTCSYHISLLSSGGIECNVFFLTSGLEVGSKNVSP